MTIRFDSGPDGAALAFGVPEARVTAWAPDGLGAALTLARDLQARGFWLAGFASYELGYVLEQKLAPRLPEGRRVPLLSLAAYRAPLDRPPDLPASDLPPLDLVPRWDRDRYAAAFGQIMDYIAAGDIYQANLTFPLDGRFAGDPLALYGALAARQPVPHGAYVAHDPSVTLLSRSPELFFEIDRADASGNRTIRTRPMKGTAPRMDDDVQDMARAEGLAQDPKNRAENLMIVDLLRNDFSRIARPGSVRVPDLFKVEPYATVHQMVSTVEADLAPEADLAAIFRAVFPCGSITGAPKIRAMEILSDLEPRPRDAYCGAIGWLAPDGRACFNVAIRTLALYPGGDLVLNVGGGVVADSTADAEYEEALWKARFTSPCPPA
nr:aminodeoxychorismate synthase component I [Oceanomicrobium pacificus]